MKKAIVIGASSGIGREIALLLSENEYRVGITGRRANLLENLKRQAPNSFVAAKLDCTNENSIQYLKELILELGGLDLLIISSGTGDINPSLEYETENRTNQLNTIAFTRIVTWGFNFFKGQGYGHIVAISSIAGLRGGAASPAYNASKAYQINYLEGLRQKVTKEKLKIAITDVRPGFVDTAMAKGEGLFWVAPTKKAALQIVTALKKKKEVVYITKRWRIIAVVLKILPTWVYKRL